MARIEVAASLVNGLAISAAGGRQIPPPADDADLQTRAAQALGDADVLRRAPDVEQARGLRALAHELRDVFVAVHAERMDEAVARLNRLFDTSGAVPHLHRTGRKPWHLHFHRPDAGLVDGWTAGCAVGLAYALSSGHADRLGVCAGPGCERVFVDLSRNGSRRFCSTACQNRVKAASYRARRRDDAGP